MTQPKIDHFERVADDRIVQTSIDGVPCWAFTVRPGDVQSWDVGNIGPNQKPNERAEISYAPAQGTEKHKSPYNVHEGMLQTYDVDLWFAAGFPPHVAAKHEWALALQFHPEDDHKANTPHGFGGVAVHDSAITFDNPNGDGGYFGKVPIVTEKWIKLRMAVKWSAGKDGYAKIVDRQTNTPIARYDGPTITAGEFKYLKQGYYRAGGLPTGMVYQTQIGISEGDLTETAPTPIPVQPDPMRTALEAAVAQLDALVTEATAARDKAKAALGT